MDTVAVGHVSNLLTHPTGQILFPWTSLTTPLEDIFISAIIFKVPSVVVIQIIFY